MRTKISLAVLVIAGVALALSGCGDSQGAAKAPVDSAAPASTAALPEGLFLKEAPAGAKDVGALKKEAKEGDEVVIRGQVGGRVEEFTSGIAALLIADMKLPPCSMRPGDKCPTPWDFCCETPEARKANTATVQVLDANGKLLKTDIKGVHGIDHLSILVVKGSVGKRDGDNLVINATGIFVEKAAPKAN